MYCSLEKILTKQNYSNTRYFTSNQEVQEKCVTGHKNRTQETVTHEKKITQVAYDRQQWIYNQTQQMSNF